MTILYHVAGDDGQLLAALRDALGPREIRVWPDCGDRDAITDVIVWQPPAGFFDGLTSLRAIHAVAAGVDRLLSQPGIPHDIPILRLEDAGMGEKMAEYVLLGVLMAQRRMLDGLAAQRQHSWRPAIHAREQHAGEFVVGILGAGQLACTVARRLQSNGYPVRTWSRTEKSHSDWPHHAGDAGLRELLPQCRVLVSLLPLTDATHGILNAALFEQLPHGAFLVNCARGEQLVERDLLRALADNRLSGALLDVFATEPLPAGHAFWEHPRIAITPHVAAQSQVGESVAQIAANFRRLDAGEQPRGVVDRRRGY